MTDKQKEAMETAGKDTAVYIMSRNLNPDNLIVRQQKANALYNNSISSEDKEAAEKIFTTAYEDRFKKVP